MAYLSTPGGCPLEPDGIQGCDARVHKLSLAIHSALLIDPVVQRAMLGRERHNEVAVFVLEIAELLQSEIPSRLVLRARRVMRHDS